MRSLVLRGITELYINEYEIDIDMAQLQRDL